MDDMQTAMPDAFGAFEKVPLGTPAPVALEPTQRASKEGAPAHLAPEDLTHAPGEIARFIARMVSEDYEGPERRGAKRYDIMIAADVLAVDRTFQPLGEPVQAMTRNISTTGIALISSRPLEGKLLAVGMNDEAGRPIQMVIRVLRSRKIGEFFETAGPFVTRFKDTQA